MILTEKIVDAVTGEETIIEREATPAELVEIETARAEAVVLETELKTKLATRQALLDRLGITEDEAKLLLS